MSSDGVAAVTGEVDARKGLLPKLRFPEFQDAGQWKLCELSELLTEPKEKNRQLKYGPEHVLSVSGEHGCVNQIDFMGRSYAGVSVKEYNVVQTGDIVYTKSPLKACPNGIIRANKGAAGIVSVLYAVYRPSASATPEFIDYYFSSDHKLSSYLQPLVKKGPKNSILVNNSDVLKGRIAAPAVAEQQKIADCLCSLDAVIAAEAERLATLRKYKKGLMQQLFPRPERIENGEKIPAETIPRLRFPEFQNAGDWEDRPLGDLLQCPPAYGANAAAVPYDKRLPTYLRITDISEDGQFITADKTSVNVVATESNSMQPGDIALTRTGASVGKAYLHTDANGPLVFAGFLIRVRPDQRRVLSKTVFQYMQTQAYWSWVLKNSARSGQPGINSSEYSTLRIPLPSDGPDGLLSEQRQIANCLSSIDDLVAALTGKITALKTHKSALVQQLFPSPADVSI